MKPLQVDLPYPSVKSGKDDLYNASLLSPVYASKESELSAILQYTYHAFYFEKLQMEEYKDTLESISIAEMHHLELLGNAILTLGSDPVFTCNPPLKTNFFNSSKVAYSTKPQQMLTDDIFGEMGAISTYKQVLFAVTNDSLSSLISRIILDEQLHLEALQELYRKLKTA